MLTPLVTAPISLPPGWDILLRDFLRQVEGERLVAYRDTGGVWTVGVGLTRLNGKPVYANQRITQMQADAGLSYEIGQTGKLLAGVVHVPLADHEAAALGSFAYNLGGPALSSSTLLKRLNAGDRAGAAAQFPAWDKGHVNGVLVQIAGLHTRRLKEQALFLGQAYVPAGKPVPVASPAQSTADALNAAQLARMG